MSITEVAPGEMYQLPLEPNQIELAIAEEFSGPELWSSDQPTHLRAGRLAGLKPIPVHDCSFYIGRTPSEHWVTLLYGSRITNPDGSPYERVQFETTSLETMVAIHAYLARTVLFGERARPSVLVDPPIARWQDVGRHPKNNKFWLQAIAAGVWPIMATGERYPGGRKGYLFHDQADAHNATSLLLPRETQDLVTQVAQHELAWYVRHHTGEVPRILSLPGDAELDPFGGAGPGRLPYKDGMYLIDNLTDQTAYIQLLHYLMHGKEETPEARLAAVEAHAQVDKRYWDYDNPINGAADGLRVMRMYTGAMVNFVSRHQHGRDTTQEVVDAEYEGFKRGAVRVARKILGGYDPASEPFWHR